FLRRQVYARRPVEPDVVAEPNEAFCRLIEPGEAPEDRGLSPPRGAEQHCDPLRAAVELYVGADAHGRRVASDKRGYEPIGHARPERRGSQYVTAGTTNEKAGRRRG